MRRRTILTLSTATVAALAGCSGDTDDRDENGDRGATNGGNGNGNGDEETTDSEPEPEPEPEEDEPPRSDADTLLSIQDALTDEMFPGGIVEFADEGQVVTDTFDVGGALTVFVFDHDGERNFQLELEGEQEELLANYIGPVGGATAVPLAGGEYLIDVNADGAWSLAIGQPFAPDEEVRTLPVSASGDGPDVVGPVEIGETVTVSGEHDGERNFQVFAYDEDESDQFAGELVFNEIGEFDGQTRADATGIIWFNVEADGEWSLSVE